MEIRFGSRLEKIQKNKPERQIIYQLPLNVRMDIAINGFQKIMNKSIA